MAQPEHPDAIFVWIPKVAGTSITALLEQEGAQILKRQSLLKQCTNAGITCFGHMKITDLAAAGIISQDYLERAFKFSIVRNPWDRCVSLYLYLTKISSKGRSAVHAGMSFRGFCVRLMLARFPVVGFRVPPVGAKHVDHLSQCNPQADWITGGDGKIFVDFVGRYENLDADVDEIRSRLGLRGELAVKNRMKRTRNYRPYYSRATKLMVEHIYRRDIRMFGYRF